MAKNNESWVKPEVERKTPSYFTKSGNTELRLFWRESEPVVRQQTSRSFVSVLLIHQAATIATLQTQLNTECYIVFHKTNREIMRNKMKKLVILWTVCLFLEYLPHKVESAACLGLWWNRKNRGTKQNKNKQNNKLSAEWNLVRVWWTRQMAKKSVKFVHNKVLSPPKVIQQLVVLLGCTLLLTLVHCSQVLQNNKPKRSCFVSHGPATNNDRLIDDKAGTKNSLTFARKKKDNWILVFHNHKRTSVWIVECSANNHKIMMRKWHNVRGELQLHKVKFSLLSFQVISSFFFFFFANFILWLSYWGWNEIWQPVNRYLLCFT